MGDVIESHLTLQFTMISNFTLKLTDDTMMKCKYREIDRGFNSRRTRVN